MLEKISNKVCPQTMNVPLLWNAYGVRILPFSKAFFMSVMQASGIITIIIIINLIEYKIMLFPLFYILYIDYRSKQSSLDDNNSNRIYVADESLERCFMMLFQYI